MSDRPYSLQVWEFDPDALEDAWRQWTTYMGRDKAMARRDQLNGKGTVARVVNTDTREIMEDLPQCPHCEESHAEPYDGTCLL